MKYHKDGFVRDVNNPGAVINTDSNGLKSYKIKKNKEKEIDNLKNEIFNIKILLHKILEKMN